LFIHFPLNQSIASLIVAIFCTQDALYSLRELSPDFSVREILGLTGDLAIVVKVPLAPALGMLRAVTFNFVTLGCEIQMIHDDPDAYGPFIVDRC
jgi:hypothetical protein